MFDYLKFRRSLWKLERARQQTWKAYDMDIAEARKRGDKAEEIADIESVAHHEDRTYEDEVYRLHTRYLWREANRLMIPTPNSDDKESWEEEQGYRHLTTKGVNELRNAIRLEKKLRREAVLMWVPLITTLTGLAGAAIGVLFTWFGFAAPK